MFEEEWEAIKNKKNKKKKNKQFSFVISQII